MAQSADSDDADLLSGLGVTFQWGVHSGTSAHKGWNQFFREVVGNWESPLSWGLHMRGKSSELGIWHHFINTHTLAKVVLTLVAKL